VATGLTCAGIRSDRTGNSRADGDDAQSTAPSSATADLITGVDVPNWILAGSTLRAPNDQRTKTVVTPPVAVKIELAKTDFSLRWHSKITEMDAIRLALFASCLLLIGCRSGHPSDDALQSRFFSHEASFTKVVQMTNEDPKIARIDPLTIQEKAISQRRRDEYRDLFRELGLEYGIGRLDSEGGVQIPISTTGLFGGRGTTKGFAYSMQDLEPVVESLNDQATLPCSGVKHCIVYRQIKRHWYIFYEIG
jgi:predicted secreted protein